MKIAGTAVLHAPSDRVWAALNDPAVLVRTIPGCTRLEAAGPDSWTMTVTAGVASIKGVYTGSVSLHDQQPPGSFRLRASGAGAPGTVDADVLVQLEPAPDGGTRLSYDADAVVGGMVGGVGQRMLIGVAKRTAGEFFSAVDAVLDGAASGAGGSGGAVSGVAVSGGAAAGGAASGASAAGGADAGAGAGGADVPAGVAAPGAGGSAPSSAGAAVAQPSAGSLWLPPAAPSSGGGSDVVRGAVVGAAAALLGVLLGSVLARQRS